MCKYIYIHTHRFTHHKCLYAYMYIDCIYIYILVMHILICVCVYMHICICMSTNDQCSSFMIMAYCLLSDYNILSKKELLLSLWVNFWRHQQPYCSQRVQGNPIFKDSGPKIRQGYGFGDQSPKKLGTWTLWG